MQTTSRAYADAVVVVPQGRIDHASAVEFEREVAPLLDASADAGVGLVFDFTHVPYISSAGLRVLMIAAKSMRARHARAALAGAQPVVAQILGISRFDAVVEIFPSVPAALQALSSAAAHAYDEASRT
ncbi:MAG TPA: STAS domain-containing protein [Casimicrobiaceae bacterium]|jgi:anti-anti-sigma factor|nr:STAS domain-containing protein [Casimicrobiaceae bacterium]